MSKKLTTEDFISRAVKIHGNKYNYSKVEYIDSHTKVCIICPEHGEFWQTPTNHLNNKGCPKCKANKIGNWCRHTTEWFVSRAKETHGNKYDYSNTKYKSLSDKVIITCPVHGDFSQIARNHIYGEGCPKCSEHFIDTDIFILRANRVHNFKYDYSKVNYTGWANKVTIGCKEHGDFLQEPGNHLHGSGCPKCQLKSLTKVFEKLCTAFPEEHILFEVGSKTAAWIGKQKLDIYFPEYNIAIEYDGEQHFIPILRFNGESGLKSTIKRDRQKEEVCSQNNCKLFRLKFDYTEEDFLKLVLQIKDIISR